MPRIRTIKPEFWSDEKLAPMSPVVRLVFLGLISMADDAGRLVDNIKSIDGFLFPCSAESSREALDILARGSRIVRYTSDSGQALIQIANWQRHQRVDKPSRHVLPEPSREIRESLAKPSRSDLGPRTGDLGPSTVDVGPNADGGDSRVNRDDVDPQHVQDATAELLALLTDCPNAPQEVASFLAGLPSPARRLGWARALKGSIQPITGGRSVPPRALVLALADFNLASRDRFPYTGACFRKFVDRAEAEMNAPSPMPSDKPENVLAKWARETAEREAAETKSHA